ncbi:hypothetical protein TIFTF001_039521 [Ficus carica]|uniref:Uncharacterized protein n=1 Tax=Ficus carica TaxID=3494 RepID=A0AA88JF68_FICCA|nr:hypothetical protein TIFTF001_039521 [Ficus carica]
MISRMQYVVSTRVRSGLVHGLSWTGLAAPITPWQRATVSKLIAILDTRQWSVAIQDCETVGGVVLTCCVNPEFVAPTGHNNRLTSCFQKGRKKRIILSYS